MSAPITLGLFGEVAPPARMPAGLAASLLFHGLGLFVISFGVFYVPPLDPRPLHDHLAVRRILLDSPASHRQQASIRYPESRQGPKPGQKQGPKLSPASGAVGQPRPQTATAKIHPARQIVLQPDLPTEAESLHEMPLPTVMVWTAENRRTPEITPPPAQKPVTANVNPAPDPPNLETELAEASLVPQISASLKIPAVVAATTPIRIKEPAATEKAPSTASRSKTPPTPAAVMVLGQLRMELGTVVLPAVHQTHLDPPDRGAPPSPGEPGQSQAVAIFTTNKPVATTPVDSAKAPVARAADAWERPTDEASFETTETERSNTAHSGVSQITLARDGQFGAVVVGAALEDQYPELNEVWRGRMAYTVYLHVGLRRSWTLEYALPSEAEAAAAGAVAQLEAPWPFSIVRPNLDPGSIAADALMIHGYVNADGRFEDLEIAFPSGFEKADFVLKSLEQWQFRPAEADGKPQRVEVLLVIPASY